MSKHIALGFALLIATVSCQKAEERTATATATASIPQPAVAAQPDPAALAPRIPLDQAKEWIDGGRVLVLDVRSSDDYLAGHIPGALHIPLSRVAGELGYLPKDRPILTYCT